MWEACGRKEVSDAFAQKTSLPWAVLLSRQKLLLMPWHDAFVLIKMWYGLCNICIRYTLVLVWHVDFVWFCVSLRHIIYRHCWYLGSLLDSVTHTHMLSPKCSKIKTPGFPKNIVWRPTFYRFRVLLGSATAHISTYRDKLWQPVSPVETVDVANFYPSHQWYFSTVSTLLPTS